METTIRRGDVNLAVQTRGDAANPALLLLHGYPDDHRVWDAVAHRLAETFYVVTYDVRGAGASSRPKRIRDYAVAELVADFRAVVDGVLPDRPFHLAGHDWGSIQAWPAVAAVQAEGRLRSFTSISGPGLDYIAGELRHKLGRPSAETLRAVAAQLGRSWYIGAFQLPLLAPTVWRAGLGKRWRGLIRRLEGLGADAPYPPADVTDAGVHGINLYRANIAPRFTRPAPVPITIPVQVVLPADDPFVGPLLYDGLEAWVPRLTRAAIDGGHWCLLSRPAGVARRIADFASLHP